MMNWMSRVLLAIGVCVMTSVTGGAPVAAQQSPSPAVDKNAIVLIPGVLTGPGTMGPRGYRRAGTPRSVRLYELEAGGAARGGRAAEVARAALDDLQSASSKAIATMATACKSDVPTTTKAELEMMDNRLETMSQAVKTLRPAFDAFYASLDSKQQQRLDVFGPRHRS